MLTKLMFASPLRVPFWIVRFLYAAVREGSLAYLRFQPGYHGSTIPSRRFLVENRERLFRPQPVNDGIDLNRSAQGALLQEIIPYFSDFDPPEFPVPNRLYHYNNAMYGFSDAFVLYAMLRHFAPRHVIELGSGYSSGLMLDTASSYLPETRFTFVDPYSTTIQEVIARHTSDNYRLMRTPAQDLDVALFRSLGANDILFIDTSHSVKIGSDLCTIFFEILPSLAPGVLVHIHDIYYPWEYPEEFVMAGRTYNEIYFVRAFLQFNSAFEILYNSAQMEEEHPEVFTEHMPGYFKPTGHPRSQSLWLRRVN